jgi:hypothetical protein
MTQVIIDILGIALFANWLTHWFSPITPIRESIVRKLIDMMVKYNMFWAQSSLHIITCARCLSFWASLVYFQNLTYALITSLIAQVLYYIIKKTNYVE